MEKRAQASSETERERERKKRGRRTSERTPAANCREENKLLSKLPSAVSKKVMELELITSAGVRYARCSNSKCTTDPCLAGRLIDEKKRPWLWKVP